MRRSPFGNPLFWLVACVVLPEVIKKCKPLAKTVGDALVRAGEQFQKAAEEPEAPVAEAQPVEEPAAETAPADPESAPATKTKKSKAPSEGEPAPEA